MSDITVEEIKQKKIDIEKSIADTLKSFEKETGVRIGYLDIQRKRLKEEKANDVESVMPGDHNMLDIETVNFDIRFDE